MSAKSVICSHCFAEFEAPAAQGQAQAAPVQCPECGTYNEPNPVQSSAEDDPFADVQPAPAPEPAEMPDFDAGSIELDDDDAPPLELETDVPAAEPAPEAPAPQAQAGGAKLYVRNAQGKVIGHLEPQVIVEMLRDHILSGDDEVSEDSEQWVLISQTPQFAAPLAAVPSAASAEDGAEGDDALAGPMASKVNEADRMGPRGATGAKTMAAQRREEKKRAARRRQIAGASVVAVIGIVGVGFALTPQGRIVTNAALVKMGLATSHFDWPVSKSLLAAHAQHLEGNWKSLREAEQQLEAMAAQNDGNIVLKTRLANARYMLLRLQPAGPDAAARAEGLVDTAALLDSEHPEVIKARALAKLLSEEPLDAVPLLQQVVAANKRDSEAHYLIGVALAVRRPEEAMKHFELSLEAIERAPFDADSPGYGPDGRILFPNLASGRARAWLGKAGILVGARRDADARAALDKVMSLAPDSAAAQLLLANLAWHGGKGEEAKEKLAVLESKAAHTLEPLAQAAGWHLLGEIHRAEGRIEAASRAFAAAVKHEGKSVPYLVDLGVMRTALKAWDEAEQVLLRAEELAADSLEVAIARTRLLRAREKPVDAALVLDRQRKKHSDDARFHYEMGEVHLALDKEGKATVAFENSVKRDRNYVPPRVALAQLRIRKGRLDEAEALLKEVETIAPESAELALGKGDLALARNDAAGAEKLLRLALDRDPTLAWAHTLLAESLRKQGKATGAIASLEEASKLAANDADVHYRLGLAYQDQAQHAEAIKAFERAIAIDNVFGPVRTALGKSLLATGDAKAAHTQLSKAVAVDRENAEAFLFFGRSLIALRRFEAAQEAINGGMAYTKKPEELLYWRAVAERDGGAAEVAVATLRKAIAKAPQMVEAHWDLAELLKSSDRCDDAIPHFEKVAAAGQAAVGERPEIYTRMGECHFQLKRPKKAKAALQSALKQDPKSKPMILVLLGRVADSDGRGEDALKLFEEAAGLDAKFAEPHYWMGYGHKSKSNYAGAVKAWDTFLKLAPEHAEAGAIREEVKDLRALMDEE